MAETALVVPSSVALEPLTPVQLKARLDRIQSVMAEVMKKDSDYGVIPGTQKPTLLKPGAEKLCVTFQFVPDDPLIEQIFEVDGGIRYRIRVPVRTADGRTVAVGVGECSTGEEKYAWRRPVHPKEFDNAPVDQKRVKYTRSGQTWNQVRVHPADVANTVLKMAHKRAYVHAVIMATAAGSIFTQDVEDLPDGLADAPADEDVDQRRPPIQPPQRKAEAAPAAAAAKTVQFRIKGILEDPQHGRVLIRAEDGKTYASAQSVFTQRAQDAQAAGLAVEVTYLEGRLGREIQTLVEVTREPGAEG